jgi:hypothetical protein
VAEEPTAENAVEIAHQWLITEPPPVYEICSGRRIGVGTGEEVERRVHQLRLLDDHVGGNDTYAMVTAELAATSGLLRDAAYPEELGRRLLVAVGSSASSPDGPAPTQAGTPRPSGSISSASARRTLAAT